MINWLQCHSLVNLKKTSQGREQFSLRRCLFLILYLLCPVLSSHTQCCCVFPEIRPLGSGVPTQNIRYPTIPVGIFGTRCRIWNQSLYRGSGVHEKTVPKDGLSVKKIVGGYFKIRGEMPLIVMSQVLAGHNKEETKDTGQVEGPFPSDKNYSTISSIFAKSCIRS